MSRAKIAGAIIATFIIAGGLGWAIGYFMPEINLTEKFNPTINGEFKSSDGWEYADYQFIEYLTLDPNSNNTNNYFYVHLTNDSLYILVDFCGDVSGETEDEWLTVWIDTSVTSSFTDSYWNSSISDGGEQMLCYIPETDTFNNTFWYSYGIPGTDKFATTLNATEAEISFGFQDTKNYQTPHRVFEIKIDVDAFESINSDSFSVAFMGYGTAAYYYEMGYWGAPSNFAEVYNLQQDIVEDRYFKCGTA